MSPHGILFDLDHTLLRGTVLNMEPALRLLRTEYNMQEVSLGTMAEHCSRLQGDLYGRSRESGFELSIRSLCRFLCSEFGYDVQIGPRFERRLFDQIYEVEGLQEGVKEVLDVLAGRKIPCGILSNNIFSGETLAHGLKKHGVASRFRSVFSSSDMGVKKPYPGVFTNAAAGLGVCPSRIWFIGDSFPNDVLGAQSAGMTAIWYNPDGKPLPEPADCPVVEHWREFIYLLPPLR